MVGFEQVNADWVVIVRPCCHNSKHTAPLSYFLQLFSSFIISVEMIFLVAIFVAELITLPNKLNLRFRYLLFSRCECLFVCLFVCVCVCVCECVCVLCVCACVCVCVCTSIHREGFICLD